MRLAGLRIALVGPLAPSAQADAHACAALAQHLRAEGASVHLIQSALKHAPGYLLRLWRAAKTVDLVHIVADGGWYWHLRVAPALWISRLRAKPVLLQYRGSGASVLFTRHARLLRFSLGSGSAFLLPSSYLARLAGAHGLVVQLVPDFVERDCLAPLAPRTARGCTLLLARPGTAVLRAFALLQQARAHAVLILAGAAGDAQQERLEQLVAELGLRETVQFSTSPDRGDMARLYQACDIVLHNGPDDCLPPLVENAMACGLPVVAIEGAAYSDTLRHRENALLVPAAQPEAVARAALELIANPALAARLGAAARSSVRHKDWEQVAPQLLAHYRRLLGTPSRPLYTKLASALLFPLHEWGKRHRSAAIARHLEQTQWWDSERLEQLQLERLRALLQHAGTHVPHYRALFARCGFDPLLLASVADLARLPLLTKADISTARERLKSDRAGRLIRANTGGSSGEPLVFYLGKERVGHDVAAKWRATRWWGVDIGDREIVVWGSPIELGAQDRLRGLRDVLLRSTLLPAFDMPPQRLDEFIERIEEIRPRMLFGYPSALSHIARHARARNMPLDGLGIRVAFVTAEKLYDEQRALIGTTFGCRVANGYGGRDAGFIAHECPEGGMHITAEDVVLEIVDAEGRPLPAGESGNIVVTHLASRDFPFIRYATGDVGALDPAPCPCGRGLPLLKRIEGRSTDFLVARDGTVMHGLALVYIVRDLPQIRAFKIIQESLDLTRVQLVTSPALTPESLRAIEQRFKARLGEAVRIDIEEVAAIAAEASGKFRYVISKVALPQEV